MFKSIFPGLAQLSDYRQSHLPQDISAGVIVAVMLIPQGMAYAMLTGVHPVYGLYAVTLPLVVYACFASSRHLSVGPVAMGSLIALAGVSQLATPGSDLFFTYIVTLTLMVGVFRFLVGIFRLGFLVNFLSSAVITGFTSAAALIIALSQLNHLLGIQLSHPPYHYQLLYEIVLKLTATHGLTLMLGLGSIILLILLRRWAPRFPAPIVVVILSILIVYLFRLDQQGVAIVGEIPRGLPTFSIPVLNGEIVGQLIPIAITIAMVNFLESTSIAKMIAWKENYQLNPNQEERAIGLANIIGSFFSSVPVTGSYSRTAANYQFGGKTILSSLVTAGLITCTLLWLTPFFFYMPTAVLAAIIIVAVYNLINLKEMRRLFRLKKSDGWTALTAFMATLTIDIVSGIISGIVMSMIILILSNARPHLAELGYVAEEKVFRNIKRYPRAKTFAGVLIVRIDARLHFANTGFLEEKLDQSVDQRDSLRWIILDMSGVNDLDSAATDRLASWIMNYRTRKIQLIFTGVKGPVRDLLYRAGGPKRFGELTYPSIHHALQELGYDLKN